MSLVSATHAIATGVIKEVKMTNTMKNVCFGFVILNLFCAGYNFILGAGFVPIFFNLVVAGLCWIAYKDGSKNQL